MLEFKELKKSYGERTVVNINHLTIRAGETIGLVGNNGAGKTTLFRMLLDLIRPNAGEILSKDVNVATSGQWKDYTASYLRNTSFLLGVYTI
jgi:ABC-2 type transport system ATP-binding protein